MRPASSAPVPVSRNEKHAMRLPTLQSLRSSRRLTAATAWLERMVAYGTEGYSAEARRRLKILNVVSYLIAFVTAIYVVHHFFVDFELWKPVIFINLFLVFAALSVPFLHRFSDIAGGLMIAFAELVALFVISAYLGRVSGVHIQYIVFAAAVFVILGLERLRLALFLIVAALALHITVWFAFPGKLDLTQASLANLDGIYASAAVTTFGLVAATVYYAFRLAERAEAETDALLRNILPGSIADRLKEQPGATIAESVEEASVLFADMKGFVALSKHLGPERTVELLNEIVLEFDRLAETHGVEKIKTIGDAYMLAAGVPQPAADHAARCVRMALAMLEAIAKKAQATDRHLELRIGIASGPLIAGVIGAKRLTYDVWGDTVNLAARLENLGEAGRIHISDATAKDVRCSFQLEHRGSIEVRGLGMIDTWFVAGRVVQPKPERL